MAQFLLLLLRITKPSFTPSITDLISLISVLCSLNRNKIARFRIDGSKTEFAAEDMRFAECDGAMCLCPRERLCFQNNCLAES